MRARSNSIWRKFTRMSATAANMPCKLQLKKIYFSSDHTYLYYVSRISKMTKQKTGEKAKKSEKHYAQWPIPSKFSFFKVTFKTHRWFMLYMMHTGHHYYLFNRRQKRNFRLAIFSMYESQRWARKFFLLVRKSQIRKYLGSFRNRKSANL
jgi:hypothetical protein